MSADRLQVAVVGCGRIGATMAQDPKQFQPATHAAAFHGNPETVLSALVDVEASRLDAAARMYPSAGRFRDVETMLRAVRPDIVCVATPPEQHRPVVEAAAAADVAAIVCEKPLADRIDDAIALTKACVGRLLFVNHTRCFDPLVREAVTEVRAGAIGRLVQGTCYYTAGVMNSGTHTLGLLRQLAGDVEWVMALANPCPSHAPGDENVDAILGLTEGGRLVLQVLDVKDYSIFDLWLLGSAGRMAFVNFGYEVERVGLCERTDVTGYQQLDIPHATRRGAPRSFMRGMASHVVGCLRGRERPVSTGEDGLAVLAVLEAIRRSAAGGGVRIAVNGGGTR